MKKKKSINPLPFNVYLGTVVALTAFGLLDAAYLAVSHYRNYTDIGYRSFCAVSRAINCDTVSQSGYAVIFGLPLAVWGIIGYVFLLAILLLSSGTAKNRQRIWALVFWLSLAYTCGSVYLALISTFKIRSYCIMCILTYGVNFALVFYAGLIRSRFSDTGLFEDTRRDLQYLWNRRARTIPLLTAITAASIFTWLFFPAYWHLKPPPLNADIPAGFTEAGHPWVGALNPELEITEFADYQCFQCKKMHYFLRQLISRYPDKIKLIHRHYPMDHKFNPIVREPFHVGAGQMALLAIASGKKNKFWEMNDLLYNINTGRQVVSVRELSEKLGLDPDEIKRVINLPGTRYQLHRDLRTGNELGITGTPAYVVDGKLHQGQLPAEIMKKIMEWRSTKPGKHPL